MKIEIFQSIHLLYRKLQAWSCNFFFFVLKRPASVRQYPPKEHILAKDKSLSFAKLHSWGNPRLYRKFSQTKTKAAYYDQPEITSLNLICIYSIQCNKKVANRSYFILGHPVVTKSIVRLWSNMIDYYEVINREGSRCRRAQKQRSPIILEMNKICLNISAGTLQLYNWRLMGYSFGRT